MKKKPAVHTPGHRHAPHFYALFALLSVSVGVIATLVITKILAQSGGDVIYTCVTTNGGNMRVVAIGEPCKSNEYALNWNKTGLQGPPGEPGGGTGIPFFCGYPCYMTPFADKFRGKDFTGATFNQTNFADADITGVIFKSGFIIGSRFNNTNLTGANFSNIRDVPGWDTVRNNKFIGANLTNANFENTTFQGSDFSNVNLLNANFSNAVIKSDNFTGATNGSSANFTGVTWISSTCPDGTNSDANGNTCAGHF